MLNVQEYLNSKYTGTSGNELQRAESALDSLATEYGIKYNIWEDKLVVLNYCQIESPKYDPIIKECRSLVLELGNDWKVVSRAFDRFFNLNEDPDQEIDITQLVAHEKVDGSLISLFCYKGEWLYRTKSVIMPDSVINGNVNGVTWKDRIEEGLPLDWQLSSLYQDDTYILELTCRENRVVTRYENTKGELTLLAIRNNESGDYYLGATRELVREQCGFNSLKVYSFDTVDHCLESAKELRNLEEGYVMYNSAGVPVCKVKNPAYVAAHRLRGDGVPSEKRIVDLIIMNEEDEYLAVFPEDKELFFPYQIAYCNLRYMLAKVDSLVYDWEGDQKSFALEVMNNFKEVSSIAFAVKSGKTVTEAWNDTRDTTKRKIVLNFLER